MGLGLQLETTGSAKAICELQWCKRAIELEMRFHMKDSRFLRYRKVFALFGFAEQVEALISQIYPQENYLVDGKPEIKIRKGRNSGEPIERHLSKRGFQKALGVAPTCEDSGVI